MLLMPKMTYREAATKALADAMRSDENIVLFGEDVAVAGGVFKVTPGLYDEFGDSRVRDTPISEQAFIGAALGAAITGLRPIAELMFADFIPVAMDQIVNQIAKYRYMSGGQFVVPLTIRAAQGAGAGFGTQHSQCVESWLMNMPGLKIVVPGTVADMYGLLRSAIEENNPVIVLEHKVLYNYAEEVPDDLPHVPLGKAKVRRAGKDVTVVSTQLVMQRSLEAAEILAQEGIDVEVIDLRSISPLDEDAILNSVEKTHRLIVVEEAPHSGGWGATIAALVADKGIYWLDAPIKRVNMGNALVAYSPPLEDEVVPNVQRIAQSIRDLVKE
jgi:acetoin:2,6-dichlorophenolindophenol oxidoreductase subunit beta